MKPLQEPARIQSSGAELAATLFLPGLETPAPAVVLCHGAGEFKEHYFEMGEALASAGLAALALDMRGHGGSQGERHCVAIAEWTADVRRAIDFLAADPRVDSERIGGFGLSSGGTAVLEAALVEPRLRALAVYAPTVRNSLSFVNSAFLKLLSAAGQGKKWLTGRQLRISMAGFTGKFPLASDSETHRRLQADPRVLEAIRAFPFPGGRQAFFVDTLKRAGGIQAPTLILWGEEDVIDPPETGRMLHEALECEKRLEVISGSGHVGHLDLHRSKLFALTAEWMLEKLRPPAAAGEDGRKGGTPRIVSRTIEGAEAGNLGRQEKWEILGGFLERHGREALAYATLQAGMEYFVDETGYIAYTTVQHPVFARRPKKITFSDPVCAPEDLPRLLDKFLSKHPHAVFTCISEACAGALRERGFKANCIGYEVELPIQTYNTRGDWKKLDLIKRARNEARREGICIREESIETVNVGELAAVSSRWMGTKKVNDREIWIYARRPVFEFEQDVRKFVAYDPQGKVAGFVFYDPMYRDGRVFGYSATISRCDEARFSKLATAVHMEAVEKFKAEGKEVLNLNLAPFVKLEEGKFNDDLGCKVFFNLSAKYGNDIYNFRGLSFHKSKYRGEERCLYFASNSLWPSNDIYLAFRSADITRSYFEIFGRLFRGMMTARPRGKPEGSSPPRPDA